MIFAFVFVVLLGYGIQLPAHEFEKTYEKACVEAAWKRSYERGAGDPFWARYYIEDEVKNCPKVQ